MPLPSDPLDEQESSGIPGGNLPEPSVELPGNSLGPLQLNAPAETPPRVAAAETPETSSPADQIDSDYQGYLAWHEELAALQSEWLEEIEDL